MGIYAIKPAFRTALAPVGHMLIRAGVSADAVTLAGLACASVAGLGVWLGRDGGAWLLLVPAGALTRTVANALDGWIAQQTGSVRPLGEVLNEMADRIGDGVVFLPVVAIPGVADMLVAVTVAVMLVTSSLGVVVKAAGGSRVYSGAMGKPDRMLVVGVGAIIAVFADPASVFTVTLWVVLAGCVLTFLQRAVVARRTL